jgi:hypothetical protein
VLEIRPRPTYGYYPNQLRRSAAARCDCAR